MAARKHAASEREILDHLERFVPPVGSEPHVWIAPIGAHGDEEEKWLDIGPLDKVSVVYPRIGEILKNWSPHRTKNWSGVFNITSEIRCQVALIGERPRFSN